MLGKIFRGHLHFLSQKIGLTVEASEDNSHEMSKPVFLERHEKISLSSAEFAHLRLKFNGKPNNSGSFCVNCLPENREK